MDTVRKSEQVATVRHSSAYNPGTSAMPGEQTSTRGVRKASARKVNTQMGDTIGMFVLALTAATLGLAYLACCAKVTAEGYLQNRLERTLKQETGQLAHLYDVRSRINTRETIEKKAKEMGMVQVTDSNTYTLK